MAHETHRFNLLLRNANHPTAKSAASLNPIFTESSHGTHYSLYADFAPRDTSKTYTTEFDVGAITVKIQNYTGAITMGISEVIGVNIYEAETHQKDFLVDDFSTRRVVELVVSVQPLNMNDSKHITLEDVELILQEGDLFETKVLHKLIDGSLSGTGRSSMSGAPRILDQKYMWRDGEEIVLEEDIWVHKGNVEMLESAAFFIRNGKSNPLQINSKKADKQVDIKAVEAVLDKSMFGHKSRRNDPKCKQKTADIYIL